MRCYGLAARSASPVGWSPVSHGHTHVRNIAVATGLRNSWSLRASAGVTVAMKAGRWFTSIISITGTPYGHHLVVNTVRRHATNLQPYSARSYATPERIVNIRHGDTINKWGQLSLIRLPTRASSRSHYHGRYSGCRPAA